jgi:hypothetical protein
VQVASSADYIGTYQLEGDTCTIGCGWCQPGQQLCHTGVNENGVPGCFMCLAGDVPDPGAECAAFLSVPSCAGGLDEPDGGLDDTGGSDDGLDETGDSDDGLHEGEGLLGYDCSQWAPADAVTLDTRGSGVVVDAALVEEIAAHYGDPLADCDDTRFRRRSDGYLAISNMATNGLLARVGLFPGDIILAIDGRAMGDLDTVASTMAELFLGNRVTSAFTVTIGRGRERITKTIRVR